MSFVGCIGYIIAGSALKDVLCQVFAANLVDKVFTGHSYIRAVRVHLLVQLVLCQIVLEGANVSEEERKETLTTLTKMEKFIQAKLKIMFP